MYASIHDAQLFLFISPASLSSSICSLQRCVSSRHSWFLHNGLVLNPFKTEAICFGTNPRLKSLGILITTFLTSALLPIFISVLFAIFALILILKTSKAIACAIVSSRLDYANSVLTGISARNVHRLQRVQNSLARVVTRSTTNSTSALKSLHWLPIRRQRIDYKLATIVHRSLHNACPQYLSSLLHTYTPTCQLRSASLNLLSQPRVNIALASRGFRHAWNLLILDLSTLTLPSNPISKLTCSVLWAFLAPNNSIHALLIRIFMSIFSVEIILHYI